MEKYYIVTPLQAQQELVNRILGHWEEYKSNVYNPDRSSALSVAAVISSWEDAMADIEAREGKRPKMVVTGANFERYEGETIDLAKSMMLDKSPCFLVFGTGWGLSASILERADYRLAPIKGTASDGHNHLSVRSAVAIYLDRLRGSLCSL